MEIHKKGGGIMFTVDHTRKSSEEELLQLLKQRLDKMKQMGTTLVETKSGYGLDLDTEVKMMRVMKQANDFHQLDLVVNYCGAHVICQKLKIYFVQKFKNNFKGDSQRI